MNDYDGLLIARIHRRTAQTQQSTAQAKSKSVQVLYYFLGNVIINIVPLEDSLCTEIVPL